MMKNALWPFAFISVLLLTACQQHSMPPAEMTVPPIPAVSDAASTQIAEAANSISASLTQLEAVEKANMTPAEAKRFPSAGAVSIPGMSSIDWNGPIEPLIRQIAKATGYRLKVYGSAPITPIVVMIHAEQDLNANIVRNAALQANGRATIRTSPENKVIELRYLSR